MQNVMPKVDAATKLLLLVKMAAVCRKLLAPNLIIDA